MKKGKTSLIIFIVFWVIYTPLFLFFLDLTKGPLVSIILGIVFLVLGLCARIFLRKKKYPLKLIPIFSILLVMVILGTTSGPSYKLKKAARGNVSETTPLTIEKGQIKGLINNDNNVEVYAGIPYAKAPVGDLRWKEPQEVEPWEGVKDCTSFAARSMQKDNAPVLNSLVDIYAQGKYVPSLHQEELLPVSEDSLYLNVWKPAGNKVNLPVLVFIHGGSLNTGTSSKDDYNGEYYASKDVVMVTITYRLGVFGYFAHPELQNESSNHTTGNYGLLDQIEALKWVNNNINYFGGDKNNITIAGESAGSSSISALCTSPLATGLFKRAIGESSSLVTKNPPHTYRSLSKALEIGTNIMKEFNCSSIEELRKVDASKLVNTKYTNQEMTLDGYALTKNPYDVYLAKENNEEALLNGYNVKEADAFVVPRYLTSPTNKDNILSRLQETFGSACGQEIYDLYLPKIEKDAFSAFNEIISVYWFIAPHNSWSNIAVSNGETVYRYQFTKENGYYGTYHSGEMIYAYHNVERQIKSWAYDESDYKLEDIMSGYFINFVKTGNPNGGDLPTWEAYTSGGQVMELGKEVKMSDDLYLGLYDILDRYNF